MKPLLCFWILLVPTGQILHAQELVQKKHIVYQTSIRDVHGNQHSGYIATMDDSTVIMSREKFALTFENLNLNDLQKFGYAEIVRVDLHSSAGVKKGMLIAGITGMIAGSIIGYSSVKRTGPNQFGDIGIGTPNVTPLQAALIGAAIGAGVGSLVGAICGHSHQVFRINGRKEKLADMREAMIRTLY
jgi:hypothetical protein